MIRQLLARKSNPIGVDIGSRSVRLIQLNRDRTEIVDIARCDLTPLTGPEATAVERSRRVSDGLRRAWESGEFSGRQVVVNLSDRQLFVQNLRVPKSDPAVMNKNVQQEAAGRIPFPIAEAELRFVEAADVRQADALVREVVLLACHRPVLFELLNIVESAGLTPVAVDVEPLSLIRSYVTQFRRDEDRKARAMFAHVGYERTGVVIAQGDDLLFVKYIDLGGRHMDEAVSRHLEMSLEDAAVLRRHNGDRRTDNQDPEIARTVADALRPIFERLAAELSMCVRYFSVTFRGNPLSRILVGGGEANANLIEWISKRLDLKCEISDPLRAFPSANLPPGRRCQWDVATGLALRE